MIFGFSFLSCFKAERTNPDDPQNPDSSWNSGPEIRVTGKIAGGNNDEQVNLESGDTYNFASEPVGTRGPNHEFTVYNDGGADLNIQVLLGDKSPDDFELDIQDIQTDGGTIAPNGSKSFYIAFDLIDTGERIATVAIQNNDPDEGNFTFTVSGPTNDAPSYDFFVRGGNGNDAGPGTMDQPFATIQHAIDQAINGDDIAVAQGEYFVSNQIDMKEGVSLYGGFSETNWNDRDTVAYQTKIKDNRNTGGASGNPQPTVYYGTSITSATIIDGFTIGSSQGSYSCVLLVDGSSPTIQNNVIVADFNTQTAAYGIYNKGASSPTIDNNIISGGGTIVAGSSYGIYNDDSSSPTIQNNTIYGTSPDSLTGGQGDQYSDTAYGIYSKDTMPIIQNNTINGGNGNWTYGISYDFDFTNTISTTIFANDIDGGNSTNTSYGIHIYDMMGADLEITIDGNSIYGGDCISSSDSYTYGIYLNIDSRAVRSLH